MKNAFANQLRAATDRGIDYGLKGMAMMATIALNNVLQDYHEDAERSKIIHEFDAEVYRVWQEFRQQTIEKNEDINELIVGYYERLVKPEEEKHG